jgi:hypothetical protein
VKVRAEVDEGAAEEPAAQAGVVTAADMVAGHVRLDISCLDRLYLNGYVAKLQTPGGVVWFFHEHRGKPIVSPALFEPIGEKFRREVKTWAQANGIPLIRFSAGERKADVMAPYLEAATAAGRSRVVAVGCAQEFQLVWTARKRDTDPGKPPQFSFTREQRRVSVFYVYIFDAQMGPGFIKICTYFPYPVKVWLNGHEWAKRQALSAGIGFTELSNGFASCDDPAALQQICDRFGPGTVRVWFERWMARLPLPLTGADRDAGFWWELSMRQVEISRTLVFDHDCHARAFFEALLAENMDLGRPENVELLFRRGQRLGRPTIPPPGGGFKTKIDRHCDLVTLNVFYKSSRLKQYLKDGVALRIETVINDPKDLRCNRLLPNLPELQDKARAINARLLETETAGQDTALVSPVIERITKPTLTGDGRKAPTTVRRPSSPGPGRHHRRHAVHGHRHHQQEPARPDDRPAAPPLQHEPGQLRPIPARPQRPHPARSRPQPLHPHPRRAAVRPHLHQGLRPRPAPAHGPRPAQRATGTSRSPRHPRQARRRPPQQSPRPRTSLTTHHPRSATTRDGKLRTDVKIVAPKVP